MAKISFSPIVDEIAGKLGNAVIQRGKANSIVRKRAIPANPRSSAQVEARAILTVISQGWRSLSESQRTAWNSAGASAEWTQTDSFGNPFQLSGEQLYMMLNTVTQRTDDSTISTPPTKASFAAITLGALTAAAGTPAVSLAYTGTLGTNEVFSVRASAQVSAGNMSVKSVALAEIGQYTSTSPLNLLTGYVNKYGTLVAGKKIFVEVWQANTATGQQVLVGSTSAVIGA